MDEAITIRLGVPEDQIEAATALYCEAFREKLVPFLGPVERAARFLSQGLVPERAFVALDRGAVVGLAGFKQAKKGLFEPSVGRFFQEYGWSAPLRLLGLALLERDEEPGCLLMDGIAVAASARGQGIGTRLLEAIEAHARASGSDAIRLDVIDSNPGARRLYERFGFEARETTDIGPFRLLFPFKRSTEMRKDLAAAS